MPAGNPPLFLAKKQHTLLQAHLRLEFRLQAAPRANRLKAELRTSRFEQPPGSAPI